MTDATNTSPSNFARSNFKSHEPDFQLLDFKSYELSFGAFESGRRPIIDTNVAAANAPAVDAEANRRARHESSSVAMEKDAMDFVQPTGFIM